jgi:hypothetical protein
MNDERFLTFSGDPITGKVPARVSVGNDNPVSPELMSYVKQRYRAFKTQQGLSMLSQMTHQEELPDGGQVLFASRFGTDTVQVYPPAQAPSKAEEEIPELAGTRLELVARYVKDDGSNGWVRLDLGGMTATRISRPKRFINRTHSSVYSVLDTTTDPGITIQNFVFKHYNVSDSGLEEDFESPQGMFTHTYETDPPFNSEKVFSIGALTVSATSALEVDNFIVHTDMGDIVNRTGALSLDLAYADDDVALALITGWVDGSPAYLIGGYSDGGFVFDNGPTSLNDAEVRAIGSVSMRAGSNLIADVIVGEAGDFVYGLFAWTGREVRRFSWSDGSKFIHLTDRLGFEVVSDD